VKITKSLTAEPSRRAEVTIFIRFVRLGEVLFAASFLSSCYRWFPFRLSAKILFLALCCGVLFALGFILVYHC
jgi:hypothetical protein